MAVCLCATAEGLRACCCDSTLERFDFWWLSFRYMRNIARFECAWSEYEAALAVVGNISDPVARTHAARSLALPARIQMAQNATQVPL